MTRKFLFCFPLRVGNLVFGYIVICVAIAVVIFHSLDFVSHLVEEREFEYNELGKVVDDNSKDLSLFRQFVADLVYITLASLLLFFAFLFICGVHKSVQCLVKTFYIYSFIHLVLTLPLIGWEGYIFGWIHFGLLLLADTLYILCLFGVKNLIEAIRRGYVYRRPEEEKNWVQ